MTRRSISAKALLDDIRKGLSDAELMGRHGLTYGQLRQILARLVAAGYIAKELLDERREAETKHCPEDSVGSNLAAEEPPAGTLAPQRSLPSRQDRVGRCTDQRPPSREPGACSPTLPLTRGDAFRFRRNGLILILVSHVLIIMMRAADKLQAWMESVFGLVILLLGLVALAAAVLGCLWRVRGLGQHAAWAIVAPANWANLLVVEALHNRYEPDTDRRDLRVMFAVVWVMACVIAWHMIVHFL